MCRECEHGVDWSSAKAVIRVCPSELHEVARIVWVGRPGATNRIVGDDDSTDECMMVSPMRISPGLRSSETRILLFSDGVRIHRPQRPTFRTCRTHVLSNCARTRAGFNRLDRTPA